MLMVIFERLYALRNQIVHSGVTYQSRLNREQLSDGCQILQAILPVVEIMLGSTEADWDNTFILW